jgi:hypothetical protein
MTKASKKTAPRKMKNKKSRPPGGRTLLQEASNKLDKGARDYANLLLDPCSGTLVHPVMTGSGQGNIVRLRDSFTVTAATTTAGVFEYRPSLGTLITGYAAAGGNLTNTCTTNTSAVSTYLTAATVKTYRCIASCLKIYNNEPELYRAGILGLANASNGTISSSATYYPAQVLAEMTHVARAPDQAELQWNPQASDETFNQNAGGVFVGAWTGDGGSTGSAGAGWTIAVTSVYEIVYNAQGGIVFSPSPPVSNNTFEQVIKAVWEARNGKMVMWGVNAAANVIMGAGRTAQLLLT